MKLAILEKENFGWNNQMLFLAQLHKKNERCYAIMQTMATCEVYGFC